VCVLNLAISLLKYFLLLFLFIVSLFIFPVAGEQRVSQDQQFTYAWPFASSDSMKPRGGVTKGNDVTLLKTPTELWRQLQIKGLDKIEKDRRAIRAMSGSYRASFDFIELVGFEQEYQPKPPYQSWGTEYVYIIKDEPFFISLQHILVMHFVNPIDDAVSSAVVKHWRQDWKFEDKILNTFCSKNTWKQIKFHQNDVRGAWSQAVYQVDDSPRYESIGRWVHSDNYSSWESEQTRRPLPRREFSVRDDYDLLLGVNRHTITPTGWVHEEDNLKVAINAVGHELNIAREAGFNRYERITDHDFSSGHVYWRKTQAFWRDVRDAWEHVLNSKEQVTIKDHVQGEKLFQTMFRYAENILSEEYNSVDGQQFINDTLMKFVE
jgi:hypothetical protein